MASYGRKRQRENINHIYVPHDLTVDILAKLPVKSLLRFKCVSKHWHSLISDTKFINLHLSHHQKEDPRVLIGSACETTWTRISMDSITIDEIKEARIKVATHDPRTMHDIPRDYFHMLYSCDGIVCFHGNLYIHVYNPCTREFRTLPQGGHNSPYGFNDTDDEDEDEDYINSDNDYDDEDEDDNNDHINSDNDYDDDQYDSEEYDYHNNDYNYDDDHCYEYGTYIFFHAICSFLCYIICLESKRALCIFHTFKGLKCYIYSVCVCARTRVCIPAPTNSKTGMANHAFTSEINIMLINAAYTSKR